MKDEVSIVIKTFERPRALERLLRSILASAAADSKILIADDSLHATASDLFERENIQYFRLPYDSGLSYGRNYLVERVTTPYCVLLDDDFVFIPETNLGILLDIVKHKDFDLAAGAVDGLIHGKPGYANLEVRDRNLSIKLGAPPRSHCNGLPVYDMVNNFFLAKTATLRDVGWDERFKIYGEHTDFFLRYSAKYRVTFTDEVVVGHEDGGYSFRGGMGKHGPGRLYRSARILGRKHDVDRFGGRYLHGVRGFAGVYIPALLAMIAHGMGFLKKRIQGRGREQ